VALTYSTTNTALYIDGDLLTNGPGVSVYPSAGVLSNGLWLGSDSTGSNQCHGILDDVSTYNYPLDFGTINAMYLLYEAFYLGNPQNVSALAPAPSQPEATPVFDAVTGPGDLMVLGTNMAGWASSSNVWLTNATATLTTNGVNLTFTIAGGSNGVAYDVFATAALTQPLTNGIWDWMGQGYPCVTYTLQNLTNSGVFLLLGTPQDSYGNGLTDAYELLVLHQNPANGSKSGDGMLDGWKVLWKLNALANNSAVVANRANYVYDGTGRLETSSGVSSSGVSPEAFAFDSEGNITSDQP
jgi:hypothetical protein